ncbi:MAG TPA: PilN domain-containing protein [Vicinamibacterales bacterium]
MLRTNLSTRPFYNERAVHALAAAVALVVLAVAAWQGVRVVRLSQYKTELNSAIRRDKGQIDYLTKEAQQVRRGLNPKELAAVAAAAKEANGLIEQRTFSWTALFNQLESTLPDDVMLTSVHPEFTDGETQVNLDIQGKRSDDIDAFWDRLDKTGAFRDIQWSAVNVSDEGLHRIQMRAVYTTAAPAAPRTAAAPRVPAGGKR